VLPVSGLDEPEPEPELCPLSLFDELEPELRSVLRWSMVSSPNALGAVVCRLDRDEPEARSRSRDDRLLDDEPPPPPPVVRPTFRLTRERDRDDPLLDEEPPDPDDPDPPGSKSLNTSATRRSISSLERSLPPPPPLVR
jgi:hypothetical protein